MVLIILSDPLGSLSSLFRQLNHQVQSWVSFLVGSGGGGAAVEVVLGAMLSSSLLTKSNTLNTKRRVLPTAAALDTNTCLYKSNELKSIVSGRHFYERCRSVELEWLLWQEQILEDSSLNSRSVDGIVDFLQL